MKILVPIDFSDCSVYALNMAKQIYLHHTESRIILFHASEKDTSSFDESLKSMCNGINNDGIACSYHISNGSLQASLQRYIIDNPIDLVVMGSHGISGKNEWFIGSNTQKTVRKLHCPILVVKEDVAAMPLERAAFVSSLVTEDESPFEMFIDFIKPLGVKELHLLTVNTSSFFSEPYVLIAKAQQKFEQIAKDQNLACHFYSDYSVEAGARHFIEELGINIVGISNHNRSPIKRIIQGSNVELIVNHINVPVLSIDYN